MRPGEFDELIRQKFDQHDFAYEPAHWDSLAEKLDGRAKKRSMIMWWWIPLAGMAASVALAMGSTSLLRHSFTTPKGTKIETVSAKKSSHATTTAIQYNGTIETPSNKEAEYETANVTANNTAKKTDSDIADRVNLRLNEASPQTGNNKKNDFNFLAGNTNMISKTPKKDVALNDAYSTFAPEEEAELKTPKVSITLLGGYNSGSNGTGYTLGGTIRKILSDKLYFESDVAVASSNNMQATQYASVSVPSPAAAGARQSAARTTTVESGKSSTEVVPTDETVASNVSYNLYYAQVSPGFGYKLIRQLSIGLGPDFQRMLVDNRPVVSTALDRNNIQVAPLFDVGFIGKTEYALTKRVKTTVSYRKGMNNIITPSDKYIDRDYLQFQLRYTIFNK